MRSLLLAAPLCLAPLVADARMNEFCDPATLNDAVVVFSEGVLPTEIDCASLRDYSLQDHPSGCYSFPADDFEAVLREMEPSGLRMRGMVVLHHGTVEHIPLSAEVLQRALNVSRSFSLEEMER